MFQFAHHQISHKKTDQRRFDEKKTTGPNTIKHDAPRDVTGKKQN